MEIDTAGKEVKEEAKRGTKLSDLNILPRPKNKQTNLPKTTLDQWRLIIKCTTFQVRGGSHLHEDTVSAQNFFSGFSNP